MSQQGKVELLEKPKYYLALTSVFRDEARFLKEWIEFYKIVGVEHFYLYNHLSKDNYLEVLSPYIKEGLVELTQLTYDPKNADEWRNLVQRKAFLNTTKTVVNDVEWLLCVDADEFVYPLEGFSLKDKLHDYDNYASLSIHFRNFLSCDVEKLEPNELLIEKLTMANSVGTWVKSVVKPRYVEKFLNSHYGVLKPGYSQVREDFSSFKGHLHKKPIMDVIAINHYKFRDLEFFNNIKLNRISNKGKINSFISENNCSNSVYNDAIFKYIPLLKEAMFKSDEISPPPLSGELGEL